MTTDLSASLKTALETLTASYDSQSKDSVCSVGGLCNLTSTKETEYDISNIISAVTYFGFDPMNTLRVMMAKWTARKVPEPPLTFAGSTLNKDYSFCDAVMVACVTFLVRANNAKKILEKTNPEHKKGLTWILTSLGVDAARVPKEGGESLPPDVVTLARIAQCFPHFCLQTLFDSDGKIPQLMPELLPGMTTKIPTVMRSNLFFSLIPKETAGLGLVWIPLLVAKELDRRLNVKKTTKTSLQQIRSYTEAAKNSSIMTEVIRVGFCQQWGLITKKPPLKWNNDVLTLEKEAEIKCKLYETADDTWG